MPTVILYVTKFPPHFPRYEKRKSQNTNQVTRTFIPPSQTEASHIFRSMSTSTLFSVTADNQHNHHTVTAMNNTTPGNMGHLTNEMSRMKKVASDCTV